MQPLAQDPVKVAFSLLVETRYRPVEEQPIRLEQQGPRDGPDVAEHLHALIPERARAIGEAARRRILAGHTYDRRALQVDGLLREAVAQAA